jgi:hypothetical protein
MVKSEDINENTYKWFSVTVSHLIELLFMSALTSIFTSTYVNTILLEVLKLTTFHVDPILQPGMASLPWLLPKPVCACIQCRS